MNREGHSFSSLHVLKKKTQHSSTFGFPEVHKGGSGNMSSRSDLLGWPRAGPSQEALSLKNEVSESIERVSWGPNSLHKIENTEDVKENQLHVLTVKSCAICGQENRTRIDGMN